MTTYFHMNNCTLINNCNLFQYNCNIMGPSSQGSHKGWFTKNQGSQACLVPKIASPCNTIDFRCIVAVRSKAICQEVDFFEALSFFLFFIFLSSCTFKIIRMLAQELSKKTRQGLFSSLVIELQRNKIQRVGSMSLHFLSSTSLVYLSKSLFFFIACQVLIHWFMEIIEL